MILLITKKTHTAISFKVDENVYLIILQPLITSYVINENFAS